MVVFAIHSHPDDIEFVIAGTLFLLKKAGCEIHYMNIANGCYGTAEYSREDIIRIRRDESLAACRRLGAVHHESLCDDMGVFYNDSMIRKVAAAVREVNPDIILTASPEDYMEDHMNACRLALGGAFVRGMINYSSIPPRPHVDKDVSIYHAVPHGLVDGSRRPIESDFVVDIGSVIEDKVEMLACHESQKNWLDTSQGFDSYLTTMKDLNARVANQFEDVSYAEGFRRHLHLGYSREETNPLVEILEGYTHTVS
jgi:LmbE family N-acetylglucosaminyl deacetylase